MQSIELKACVLKNIWDYLFFYIVSLMFKAFLITRVNFTNAMIVKLTLFSKEKNWQKWLHLCHLWSALHWEEIFWVLGTDGNCWGLGRDCTWSARTLSSQTATRGFTFWLLNEHEHYHLVTKWIWLSSGLFMPNCYTEVL